MSEQTAEQAIKWSYSFQNKGSHPRHPDLRETWETEFNGKSVVLEVRVGGHPIFKMEDILRLKVLTFFSSKELIGLQTVPLQIEESEDNRSLHIYRIWE